VATCPSGHESASDDFCDVCGVLIGAAPSLVPGLAPDAASAQLTGSPAAENTVAGGTVAAAAPRWSEDCPRCGTPRDGQFCESCGHDFAAGGAGPVPVPPVPPVPPGSSAQAPAAQAASAQAPFAQAPSAQAPSAQAPSVQVAGAQVTVDPRLAAPVPPAPVPPGPAPDVSVPPGLAPGAPGPGGPGSAAPAATGAWTAVVTADRAYYDSVQAAGGPDAAAIAFPAYCPQRRFPLDRAEVRIGRHSASSGINPEIDLSVPPADPGISRLHAVLLRAADGSWAIVDPGSANGTLLNGAQLAPGQIVPVRDGDRIHLGAWTELRLTCRP
jgi:hypothetical protein